MEIKYTQKFYQGYKILSHNERELVKSTLDLFQEDPYDLVLCNHPLGKPMAGQRAISAGDDLRIIFREKGGYTEVLMLNVGDHDRVY